MTKEEYENFKSLKNEIKQELKAMAKDIRRGKFLRKPDNRDNITDDDRAMFFSKDFARKGEYWFNAWKVDDMGQVFRHKHVAYCQFFNGTEYKKMEIKTRQSNKLNQDKVKAYFKLWEVKLGEVVRSRAA